MTRADELKHCRSVRVVVLLAAGTDRPVGKVVGHWSDNPNGSVCTVSLYQFGHEVQTARAGGGGYDKFAECLSRLSWHTFDHLADGRTVDEVVRDHAENRLPYNGVESWFADRGVTWLAVLS